MVIANSVANMVVGLGPMTEGFVDLSMTCSEIGEEEDGYEHVDARARLLFSESDQYAHLMDACRHTAFLSKPRICLEIPIAVSSILEGISLILTWTSGAFGTLSSFSSILTCAAAASVFLSFGIAAAVINGLEGTAAVVKGIWYQGQIKHLDHVKNALTNEPELEGFFTKEQNILKLRRNEALEDIAIAIAVIALFVFANIFSCGLVTIVVMAIASVALCIYKYRAHRKTDKKVAALCREMLAQKNAFNANAFAVKDLAQRKSYNAAGQEMVKAMIIACREAKCLDAHHFECIRAFNDKLLQPIRLRDEDACAHFGNSGLSWDNVLHGLRSIASPFMFPLPATI